MAKMNKTMSLDQDVVEYLTKYGNASLLITELVRDHRDKVSKTVLDIDKEVLQVDKDEARKQLDNDLRPMLESRRVQMVMAFNDADRSNQYIAFAKWFKAAYPTKDVIKNIDDLAFYVKELEKVYVRCFEVV